jgi:glycosyltransferase involved in cell wall biosynthesis
LTRLSSLRELVVLSLEAWNDVWRRNQFFVDILIRRNPNLRVLFVEPPSDPLHAIRRGNLPSKPSFRRLERNRLNALTPIKPLPRRAGQLSDRALLAQVALATRLIGLRQPVLWLNDATYAPLIQRTGLPSVYDITDDWLLGPLSDREVSRLRRLEDILFAHADEVVVCSDGLRRDRGKRRPVTLIPNGVDATHFRRPQPRPTDLPATPVAVYVGTLHESRLDIDVIVELAQSVPRLSIALVGPNSLSTASLSRLRETSQVILLGPRAYESVPGYLQHADVIIVPHVVSPFTESLDPIKAYECLASRRPTVATPVAGFREHADRFTIAAPDQFAARVRAALECPRSHDVEESLPSWQDRAREFEEILIRAMQRRDQ